MNEVEVCWFNNLREIDTTINEEITMNICTNLYKFPSNHYQIFVRKLLPIQND